MKLCEGISTSFKNQVELLHIETAHSTAVVSLLGGHVLSFISKSDLRDRLWVSETAIFDNHHSLRGGVPVCWPWFSDAHNQDRDDLPSHGFVRTQKWTLVDAYRQSGVVTIKLQPENFQGPGWQFNTPLTLTLIIGKTLKILLCTKNQDTKPVNLNCALHTYFNISDIESIKLLGLSGRYRDKTQDWLELDTPTPYMFTQETDRVHLFAAKKVEIDDGGRLTSILSTGHDSMVVWNPWALNSEKMNDMQDNGFRTMVCVETAITQHFTLVPGDEHVLVQEII